VTVRDADGAAGTASVDVVVSAPAQAAPRATTAQPAAPQPLAAPETDGDVAGDEASAFASIRRPRSVRALLRRGVRIAVACSADGNGRAVLKVARKAARRLGLRKRKLAVRTVECAAGERATVRLRPRKAARRKLARVRAVTLLLRVRVDGAGRVERKLRIR
jgi:hypothetical protein